MQIQVQIGLLLVAVLVIVESRSPMRMEDYAAMSPSSRRQYNPSPTYFFSQFFGKELKGNYFFAYQYCASVNMQVATPHTPEEMFKLIEFMRDEELDDVWTSGNDLTKEGNFLWMINSKPMDFADWHPKQPDNEGGAENCVEVRNIQGSYRLNDHNCTEKFSVVCQHRTYF